MLEAAQELRGCRTAGLQEACGALARASEGQRTLGSVHVWTSLSVESPALPHPRSSEPGSQDASITAHQGDDIIAHWQGYLSRDREAFCFFFWRANRDKQQFTWFQNS